MAADGSILFSFELIYQEGEGPPPIATLQGIVQRRAFTAMKLLGHSHPQMTLQYLQITLKDLQCEYRKALANSPHLVPSPRALPASSSRADLPSLLNSLDTAAHILEMFRRALPDGTERRLLRRIGNRIAKIVAQLRPLNPPPK